MDKLSNPKLIFTLKSKEISILGLVNSRFNPENRTKNAVIPPFFGSNIISKWTIIVTFIAIMCSFIPLKTIATAGFLKSAKQHVLKEMD